jgi:hypothetical protein
MIEQEGFCENFKKNYRVPKQALQPVSRSSRKGALFIFVINCFAVFGYSAAKISEGIDYSSLEIIPIFIIGLHVFGSVAITGYAPYYLRFAHDLKESK